MYTSTVHYCAFVTVGPKLYNNLMLLGLATQNNLHLCWDYSRLGFSCLSVSFGVHVRTGGGGAWGGGIYDVLFFSFYLNKSETFVACTGEGIFLWVG